jgi:hypothetical protein
MAGVRCVGVSKRYALLGHEHDLLLPFCRIHRISLTGCHFSSLSHMELAMKLFHGAVSKNTRKKTKMSVSRCFKHCQQAL